MTSINFNSNLNYFRPTGRPDEDAKTYANQNGISVEEAKNQLFAKYGDPVQNGNSSLGVSNLSDVLDNYDEQNTENPLNKILELLMGLIEKLNNTNTEKNESTYNDEIVSVNSYEAENNLFTGSGISSEENIFEDFAYTTSDEDITSNNTASNKITSTKKSTKKSENNKTDNTTKKQDNKYKEVADELGYDKKTVSAIMKYVAGGNVNGSPDKVVPQVAQDLGLPQNVVSDVLKHCNNGNI